jgi:O-antigen/teichoic acid export membrane protein
MNLAGNTFWVFLDKLIKLVGGLFIGIWVTRYLGPEQFGVLNHGLLLLAVCTGFIPGALKYYYIKEIGAHRDDRHALLAQAAAQLMLVGLLSYGVALAALWFSGKDFLVGWLLISAAVLYPLSTIKYHIESESNFRQIAIIENTGFVISGVFKVIVIQMDWGLRPMAAAFAVDTLITGLCLLYILAKRPDINVFPAAWSAIRSRAFTASLAVTGPLFLTSLISIIYVKVDQLIVSYLLTAHDLGIYAAGARIGDVGALFPVILITLVYPVLSRQHGQGDANFTDTFRAALAVLFYAGITYTLLIKTFAQEITHLLYQSKFDEAAKPLAIMTLATTTTYLGYLWNSWLILENQGKLLLRANVLCIVLSSAGAAYLVPRHGLVGAAEGTAAAFMVSAVYGFFSYKPRVFFAHLYHALINPLHYVRAFHASTQRRAQ